MVLMLLQSLKWIGFVHSGKKNIYHKIYYFRTVKYIEI